MQPMRNLTLLIVFFAVLAACSTARKEEAQSAQPAIDSLFKNYHEESRKLFPLQATSAGDYRYNDQLPNTASQENRDKVRDFYERYQKQLADYDRSKLSENDQISYDILAYQCRMQLEGMKFKNYLMPISQIGSLTLQMAQLGSGTGNQPFKTVKDYDDWLRRLNKYLEWCDSAMVNMRKGIANGYVIPKANAMKIPAQLSNFDHGPAKEQLFYAPIKKMPAEFGEVDVKRLEQAYEDIIANKLIPMHAKMKAFIENEYIPACRTTSGIDGIPEGKEFYAFAVKQFTTTDKTPDEIFALGK